MSAADPVAFPEFDDAAALSLDDAVVFVQEALEQAEVKNGPDSLVVAGRLVQLAKILLAIGWRIRGQGKAGPLIRRALAIATAAYGEGDIRLLALMELLAVQIMTTHHGPEAEALRKRALEIAEKTYGPDHPEVAVVVGRLAGQYPYHPPSAEPLRRRALAIDVAALGPDHPRIADDLAALASSLQEWDYSQVLGAGTMVPDGRGGFVIEMPEPPPNRSAEVQELLERALAVAEVAYGAEHPALVATLCELADVVGRRGDSARADELRKRAAAIRAD